MEKNSIKFLPQITGCIVCNKLAVEPDSTHFSSTIVHHKTRNSSTVSSRSAKALLQLELLSLLFIFLFSFQSKTKRYLPYKQSNRHFNLFSLKSCKIERSKDKLSHRARLPSSTSHVAMTEAKYSDDRDVMDMRIALFSPVEHDTTSR